MIGSIIGLPLESLNISLFQGAYVINLFSSIGLLIAIISLAILIITALKFKEINKESRRMYFELKEVEH